MISDCYYLVGMRTRTIEPFERAAALFPIYRQRRLSVAYAHILLPDKTTYPTTVWEIRKALATDRNTADLWFHLMRVDLKLGNEPGYTTSMVQLQRLTPRTVYRVIQVPKDKEQP